MPKTKRDVDSVFPLAKATTRLHRNAAKGFTRRCASCGRFTRRHPRECSWHARDCAGGARGAITRVKGRGGALKARKQHSTQKKAQARRTCGQFRKGSSTRSSAPALCVHDSKTQDDKIEDEVKELVLSLRPIRTRQAVVVHCVGKPARAPEFGLDTRHIVTTPSKLTLAQYSKLFSAAVRSEYICGVVMKGTALASIDHAHALSHVAKELDTHPGHVLALNVGELIGGGEGLHSAQHAMLEVLQKPDCVLGHLYMSEHALPHTTKSNKKFKKAMRDALRANRSKPVYKQRFAAMAPWARLGAHCWFDPSPAQAKKFMRIYVEQNK